MQNLYWIRKGKTDILASEEHVLIALTINSTNGAEFILNNKKYQISTKGSWNPVLNVSSGGSELLKLTHSFWGSKGEISFNDGSIFESEYTSKGGLKLRFSSLGTEILSYGVAYENNRPGLLFSIGVEIIDADKLLILAALGMTMFSGFFKEITDGNDTSTQGILATMM